MEDMIQADSNEAVKLSRVSWFAYFKELFRLVLVAFTIIFVLKLVDMHTLFPNIQTIIICFFSIIILYKFFYYNSIELYYNHDGVWVYKGVFPWQKGVSGVKWRDLDEAVFFTGFTSWLLRTYKIRIGHRYTKSSEILLTDMYKGHIAAVKINDMHKVKLNDIK